MAKVHILLQGKGGVGKSFIAAMIAQYKISKGHKPTCIDTDPVNATFHGFQALNVHLLQILEGDGINSREFATLVELVGAAKDDVVIDNGAVSFVPLSHYLLNHRVPARFEQIVHTVVTGGQALLSTVNGFAQLVSHFPEATLFVVWLNPFWGPVEQEGKSFEQMKAYSIYKNRVSAIVEIPSLNHQTFGRDLRDMLQEQLTFDEALAMASRTIITRQRLKMIQRQFYERMDAAAVL